MQTLCPDTEYSAQDLARWMRLHSVPATVGLRGRTLYVDASDDGETDWLVIPATVEAVQAHLGY